MVAREDPNGSKPAEEGTTVPYSKSGIVPRSSLSGAGQLGFWEIGKGGSVG